MSRILPLFPLRIVVFPGELLNLHIFEPRYKQLINECEAQGISFGIPSSLKPDSLEYGSEVRLESVVKRYAKGEMDVSLKAEGLIRVLNFNKQSKDRLYPSGDVENVPFNEEGEVELNVEIMNRILELYKKLHIRKDLPSNPLDFKTFEFAHYVGFSIEQEYEFLMIGDEVARQEIMLAHLKKLIPTVKQMERLQDRVRQNGHFRDALPPDFKI